MTPAKAHAQYRDVSSFSFTVDEQFLENLFRRGRAIFGKRFKTLVQTESGLKQKCRSI